MGIRVHAIFGKDRIPLAAGPSAEAAIIPAAYLTFELEGDGLPSSALLDKRSVPLSLTGDRRRGHFMLDAFRSVGFHCLELQEHRFYFATEDAKLKLRGIQQLLSEIGRSGLAWGHQLYFSDGARFRDPRVDYAWLSENASQITRVVREIAARPLNRINRSVQEQSRGGGRVLVAQTLRLIRGRGAKVLNVDERGSLDFSGVYYSPRVAMVASRRPSFDTVANRRVAQLLGDVVSLIAQVLRNELPSSAANFLQTIGYEIESCLQIHPFCALVDKPRVPDDPVVEEQIDDRYALSFRIYSELRRELGWEPGMNVSEGYAYVAYSDQIYQAFVAAMIAKTIGAKPVGSTLEAGLSSPAFRSEDLDIYYDTVPPSPEFHNWRNDTTRPSEMRPDLTIIDRPRRRGLLIDAKYRIDGSGRVPGTALNECQVYMHSFEQEAIGVCYPGSGARIEEAVSGRFRIIEASIAPYDGVREFVASNVWPRLRDAMQPLRI